MLVGALGFEPRTLCSQRMAMGFMLACVDLFVSGLANQRLSRSKPI